MDFSSNEEYTITLECDDINLLSNGNSALLLEKNEEELSLLLLNSLSLIQRDGLWILVCEKRVFFPQRNTRSKDVLGDLKDSKDKRMIQTMNMNLTFSGQTQNTSMTKMIDNTTSRSVTNLSQTTIYNYNQNIHRDAGVLTDFKISELYEGFIEIYNTFQKLGKLKFNLSIKRGKESGNIMIYLKEVKKLQLVKLSLIKNENNLCSIIAHNFCIGIDF